MMKNYLKKFLIAWLLCIFSCSVFSQNSFDPMNIPTLTSYVSDFSQVLSQSDLLALNEIWQNYENQTTNQFVTILFPHRNWNELFDIGMKLFNENKIGQAWKNNWLLLLIATEEKKIRIIVWYGLEWNLPDALLKRIIEEDIRPLVDQWEFAWAVRTFYQRCIEILGDDWLGSSNDSVSFSSEQKEEWLWIFGLILWAILASLIRQKKISKSLKTIIIPLLILIIVSLIIWLGTLIIVWIVAGLIFWFTGFLPWRGGKWFWWGSFWWFSGGGFGGGWWSSGGGWAGD